MYDVSLGALRPGRILGKGGQGNVYELARQDGLVYKEYLQPEKVNGTALFDLVGVPARLGAADRDLLLRQAAWPLHRVVDGTRVMGFLMHRVPAPFWGSQVSGPKLREVQFLMFPRKPLWGDIHPLDGPGRLAVARAWAALFRLLHTAGIVVGDVSMRNALWSPAGGVFLLDCDGARLHGRLPVMAQPETLDWNDPLQPETGPELDTDRYKLALLITRILTCGYDLRPGTPPAFVAGLPPRVVTEVTKRFAEAAGPVGTRPTAHHWERALSDRGVIDLPAPGPVRTPPNLPKAPMDRAARPVIDLRGR
ncbi:hypothetical protein [Herbidospora mongoliensis]|uniref:hypothetical protein n=1 Tax=Herbidospora mongoliensis TaxID=688067 RepID=UPI00082D4BBF|nr:hypothetical protein [Herbidospora mongoliensis]